MKVRISTAVKMLAVAAAMVAASGASAQSKGQLTAVFGAGKITPHVESGNISAPALPNSKGDVSANTQPIVVLTYGLTDNIAVETAVAPPYKHKIYGADAISGTGELGKVQALPATLFVKYNFFEPNAMIRPFVGVGATYAYFFKETGSFKMTSLTNPGGSVPTTFSIDNKFTYSAQAGVNVSFSERLFASATFVKTKLRTDVHFSTGQYQHMKLDPSTVILGIGYKF
ncbi:MAG TPA: OmpW family outer membrane protein [Telluria sp.]|nr:OmpW family outer membrane protein [Telluria sp.]